jgi:hypothetical protein
MKKISSLTVLFAMAVLMLLPVANSVNTTFVNHPGFMQGLPPPPPPGGGH